MRVTVMQVRSATGFLSLHAFVQLDPVPSSLKPSRPRCSMSFQPRVEHWITILLVPTKDYYHGAFELDDIELGEHELMRLGNVIVPNASYGEIIEAVVMPALEDIYNDRLKETGKTGADAWIGFGSIHLVWELGKRIGKPDSLIYWAWKNQIPVCIPGITDGSIGAQLFMFRQKHRDFHIDTLADEQVMSDLTWDVETSNALMVGGGISKHHVIWWNQYRGGLDAAVYVTTAPEHDGSLSGARLREAISWGKMRPEAPNVCVEGDASVLLPLLGSDIFNR